MFRTMQTSSAACALYAVGAPAEAVALWASGAPRSALQLQEMGWSPGCGPSPKARHCPSLAMASSWCWAGDVVGTGSECPSPERGEAAAYENVQRGPLIQKLAACVCVCVCKAWGPYTPFPQHAGSASSPQPGARLQPEHDVPGAGMARLDLPPTRAVAKLQP